MTRRFFVTAMKVAAVLALAGACTTKSQEAPPLTGPSELDKSIWVAVSPDVLPLDGTSQSFITVTARDAANQPIRNMTLRAETRVEGTPVDFGTLSARSISTGQDGRATLVYTAPLGAPVAVDTFLVVDIVVTPVGSDFNNTTPRSAAIRLTPQGGVVPGNDLRPDFAVNPADPVVGQTALFDASASTGSIVEYRWNFGDGSSGSGRTTSKTYAAANTYVVTLTVIDPYGRAVSTSKSITVGLGARPVAEFIFSPTAPRVGQQVNFNASSSVAASGQIVSYTWDFGDGSPLVTVGSPTIAHAFGTDATYNVTLVVTDESGRSSVGKSNQVAISN
jgi:PKD repeat protein